MTAEIRLTTVSVREAIDRFKTPLGMALAAVVLGLTIVVQPVLAGVMVALALMVAIHLTDRNRLYRIFLVALTSLLLGYDLIGRGFAYLGVAPLYPGEVVLSVGLLGALLGSSLLLPLRSPVSWVYLAFAGWCAARTFPFIGTYHIDAFRDAVLWAYGAFALIVAAALLRTGWWRKVPVLYARILPWLVMLLPVVFVITEMADEYLPSLPNTPEVFVPQVKPGDLSVQLAGLGAFLLLGLRQRLLGPKARMPEPLLWTAWLVAFMLSATSNRGGMVAVVMALGVVLVLRPSTRWLKVAVPTLLLLGLAAAVDLQVPLRENREVSVRQLVANAVSVFGVEPKGENLQTTVEWRTLWWRDILDYTIHGPYRWTGKGFGVNLADDDGYQVTNDHSLRSPHNGHMTILARAGVPGLALWLLLQAVFAVSLAQAFLRARGRGQDMWASLDQWVFAFWLAFMVNAAFDVFLEGPMGGIWYWSLMGFGIAILEVQRRGVPWGPEAAA